MPHLPPTKPFSILRKGMHAGVDFYSAFVEADGKTTTGLAALLHARGVKRVFACGLATDYCVAFSALDARAAEFESFVIEDACRAIDANDFLDAAWAKMNAAKVRRIESQGNFRLNRGCEKSVRKRHQGVFFPPSQGVSLKVDFRWYGSSDCVLGSTENRISGSNPTLSCWPHSSTADEIPVFTGSSRHLLHQAHAMRLAGAEFIAGEQVAHTVAPADVLHRSGWSPRPRRRCRASPRSGRSARRPRRPARRRQASAPARR